MKEYQFMNSIMHRYYLFWFQNLHKIGLGIWKVKQPLEYVMQRTFFALFVGGEIIQQSDLLFVSKLLKLPKHILSTRIQGIDYQHSTFSTILQISINTLQNMEFSRNRTMKFREIGDKNTTNKDNSQSQHRQHMSHHRLLPSPLLDKNVTVYTQTMRDSIKNSFGDKLALMRDQIRLYDFQQDPNKLKATAHTMNIPSLLPPELSFQIAQCIRQNKLPSRTLTPKPEVFVQAPRILSPIQHRFRHRKGVKQLQCWLRKKLQNPPTNESESVQYKNQIMWLGMKEVIRIIKLRCLDEGNFVEEVWELTWKICQDVILYLTSAMNKMRSEVSSELSVIENLCTMKMPQEYGGSERMRELEAIIRKLQEEDRHQSKIIKELKSQVTEERDGKESFERGYMRVLEENIVLQACNVEKRDWVKKLYKTVKNYKARVAIKMKSDIRSVAEERAKADGEMLNLEDIDVPDFEEEVAKENGGVMGSTFMSNGKECESVEVQTEGGEMKDTATGMEETKQKQEESAGVEENQQELDELMDIIQIPETTAQIEQPPSNEKTFRDAEVNTIMTSGFALRHDITPEQTPAASENKLMETADACVECLILPQISKQTTLTSSCQDETLRDITLQKTNNSDQSFIVVMEQFRASNGIMAGDRINTLQGEQAIDLSHQHILEASQESQNISKKKNSLKNPRKSTTKNFRSSQHKKPKPSLNHQSLGDFKSKHPSIIQQSLLANTNNALDTSNEKQQTKSNLSNNFSTHQKSRNPTKSDDKKMRSKRDRVTLEEKGLNRFRKEKTPEGGNLVKLDMKQKFSETYKKMQRLLKMDRSKFVKSVQSRRSFVKLESMIVKDGAPVEEETPYCAKLVEKLSKINFTYLSRIKPLKQQLHTFKDLVKNLSSVQVQSQKNMLTAIQKHLIPVVAQQIRTYKKIKVRNSYSTFCEYMRLQLPLPLIVLKKFTQKYGVKALAVKNLRQILRYVEVMRSRSTRDQLIYQLLLADSAGDIICDNMLLYIGVEAMLDPGITSLSSTQSKLKIFNSEQLTFQILSEVTKPYISDEQLHPLVQTFTSSPTDINSINLSLLSLFSVLKTSKMSSFRRLFQVLSYPHCTVSLSSWSNFVCSLDLPSSIQLALLKSFLTYCNLRSQLNKYEMTEDKFNSFLIRTRFLEWALIEAKVGEFSLVRLELTKENFLEFMIRENCNEKLVRFIESAIQGERVASKEGVEFAWDYLQYLVARDKVEKVFRELLGGVVMLTEKEAFVAGSSDSTIRSMFDIFHK